MRVAFVTTADVSAIHDDVDLPLQEAAFGATGIELLQVAWEDESAEWEAFDLVVVRSPWNYVEHLAEFRAWLESRRENRRFHNPVPLIEWNLNKRYLADLAQRGVPVVPTQFVETLEEFRTISAAMGSKEFVVKPSISAGSRLTGRFREGDPAAEELARTILANDLMVMVQPFAERIDVEGEIGTVVFDGAISHSFRKAAVLDRNGGFVGGTYREEISAVAAPEDVLEVVQSAVTATRAIARENGWISESDELLYGRYDVIRLDDGTPVVLEAELFEPCFFLPVDPDAANRFVQAVTARLS
jgi:glutathione synthase/RimK-type ligase-like ATP-grasp enzyme